MLNIATLTVVAFLIVYFYAQTATICTRDQFIPSPPLRFEALFLVIAGFFLIVGLSLLSVTSYYYPSFYKDFGNKLILVILLIVLPLVLQSLINIFFGKRPRFFTFFTTNQAITYPFFIIITQDTIIVTQLATLIFGLNRLKSDQTVKI